MAFGIMYSDISDHLPIFVIDSIKQLKSVRNINDTKFIRDMSNFFVNAFNNDFTRRLNQLNTSDKMSVHKIFDQFINSFLSTVNKHAPLKKDSRREKKLRLKPWFTASLIKLIRYKNRLFKNIIRYYGMENFDDYKRYRNVLH